jgi:hypothetical protein
MEKKPKQEDFNNELGKAFEKHAGILLSKTLNKQDSVYFNLNFNIFEAITSIKSKLILRLGIDKCNDNNDNEKDFQIYKDIKELIKICNNYLKKLYEFSDSKKNFQANQKKLYLENQIHSANENRTNTNIKLNFDDTPQYQQIFGAKNEKGESGIDSSNIISGDQGSDFQTKSKQAKKNKKKSLIKGEIDVLIANVKKQEFQNLLKTKKYIKYCAPDSGNDLPEIFNIIVEVCVNLKTQQNEKANQIKKYNLLIELIENLNKKNPSYLTEYLSPFNKPNACVVSSPHFIIMLATNSSYDYFLESSRKFTEDKNFISDYTVYLCYIKFKLKDDTFGLTENNELSSESLEKIINGLKDQLAQQKEDYAHQKEEFLKQKEEYQEFLKLKKDYAHQNEEFLKQKEEYQEFLKQKEDYAHQNEEFLKQKEDYAQTINKLNKELESYKALTNRILILQIFIPIFVLFLLIIIYFYF